MAKRRDRLEIIKDILYLIQEKGERLKPTHIMYKANLSHQMLTEYLTELKGTGMLIEVIEKKKKIFRLTDKGHSFLKDYGMMRGFMESYGIE
jgi:predicted transcriptional regulator